MWGRPGPSAEGTPSSKAIIRWPTASIACWAQAYELPPALPDSILSCCSSGSKLQLGRPRRPAQTACRSAELRCSRQSRALTPQSIRLVQLSQEGFGPLRMHSTSEPLERQTRQLDFVVRSPFTPHLGVTEIACD